MDPVSLAEQVRKSVLDAVLAWAFLPVLAGIVRYGDVVLTFHNGELRDVQFPGGGGCRAMLANKSPC